MSSVARILTAKNRPAFLETAMSAKDTACSASKAFARPRSSTGVWVCTGLREDACADSEGRIPDSEPEQPRRCLRSIPATNNRHKIGRLFPNGGETHLPHRIKRSDGILQPVLHAARDQRIRYIWKRQPCQRSVLEEFLRYQAIFLCDNRKRREEYKEAEDPTGKVALVRHR